MFIFIHLIYSNLNFNTVKMTPTQQIILIRCHFYWGRHQLTTMSRDWMFRKIILYWLIIKTQMIRSCKIDFLDFVQFTTVSKMDSVHGHGHLSCLTYIIIFLLSQLNWKTNRINENKNKTNYFDRLESIITYAHHQCVIWFSMSKVVFELELVATLYQSQTLVSITIRSQSVQ